jgi:hypothetical protein
MDFQMEREISVEECGPNQAAHGARAVLLKPNMQATEFAVREHPRRTIHRNNPAGDIDRLGPVELSALRADLRLLQCKQDVSDRIKNTASMMLIFLIKEE